MSENIKSFIDELGFEYIIIDRGNGEFTSMPKTVWDELEANKKNGTLG